MNGRVLLLFISVVAFSKMLSRGVLTMIQNFFSGNVITYTVLAGVLSFFRKYQPGTNNELERTILALNNELQRMRAENEWRNDAISQGKHDLFHVIGR
jgi:hypothetical protein